MTTPLFDPSLGLGLRAHPEETKDATKLRLLLQQAEFFEKAVQQLDDIVRSLLQQLAKVREDKPEAIIAARILSYPSLAKAMNRPLHECKPLLEALDILECDPNTYGEPGAFEQ